MAKDDNGGLLSKVVKFVRNPATNWADLDLAESQHESGNSKQMLKELIERKKRNDFVRKREFEMLRKLRRRELAGTQSSTPRPSFFQSSMPSKPDERAQTLKKIDEIEAQMSMQWWKTKHRDSSANSSGFPPSVPAQGAAATQVDPEIPQMSPVAASGAPGPESGSGAFAPAVADGQGVDSVRDQDAGAPTPSRLGGARAAGPRFEYSGGNFAASGASAVVVRSVAQDPELEGAAIRFANGDDQGAEAGLLDALGNSADPASSLETWLTLFDLYRATGQQDRFDVAAIDFANQFQRSAPQWFSMPEMVSRLAGVQPASATAQTAHWSCPPVFGIKSAGVLRDVIARTPPPWRLDWTRLSVIEPEALPVLGRLFSDLAERPVELGLTAVDHLEQVLAAGAPSGDRSISAEWWHARMALLRVLNSMDEFEMTALNYCVTYEVSPPSWATPRCVVRALNSRGDDVSEQTTIISSLVDLGSGRRDAETTDFRATTTESVLPPPPTVELSGSIIGDVSATIERLEARFAGADFLSISCMKLVRVDFSAAGTLLNWVSSLQTHGRQVQFTGVHRLIAGFFNVIGISESARIVVRSD
jgi:ABC-type transporter Mla MlaB component